MANFLDKALDNVGKTPTGGTGFTPGAHTAKIALSEATTDTKGRSIIKIFLLGDNNEEAEATLWLHTEGGSAMAVTKVLGILVHNVSEEKKPTISDFGKRTFANIKKPEDVKDGLLKILNEKLVGKEAFIYAEEPAGNYTTTKYVDLWHYDQSKRAPKGAELDHDSTIDNVDGEEVAPGDLPNDLFD